MWMRENGFRWQRVGEHRFFRALAVALVALVFAGFAPTFYLHPLFGMPAPPALLAVHGTFMSGWIVLLAVQVMLISAGRVGWHQRLGIAGAMLAAVIVPLGCMATLVAAQREVRLHSAYVSSQLTVLGLELTQLTLFAAMIGAALWFRRRPATHKRLMIIATLCIVPNAIVRLALLTHSDALAQNIVVLSIWALVLVGVVVVDSLRAHRIEPAFGYGASIAIAALYSAWYLSTTPLWISYWSRVLA